MWPYSSIMLRTLIIISHRIKACVERVVWSCWGLGEAHADVLKLEMVNPVLSREGFEQGKSTASSSQTSSKGHYLFISYFILINYLSYTSESQQMFRHMAQCLKRKRETSTYVPSDIFSSDMTFIYPLGRCFYPKRLKTLSFKPMNLALQALCTTSWVTKNTHKRERGNIVKPSAVYYWQWLMQTEQ